MVPRVLDWQSILMLAQEAADQAAGAGDAKPPGMPGLFSNIMFPVLLTVAVVLLLNPFGKREDKKQKELIASLKKNDRVLLVGGIYGLIVQVRPEGDEVVLKIDEDLGTKITVTKAAILRKIDKAEAAQEKPSV